MKIEFIITNSLKLTINIIYIILYAGSKYPCQKMYTYYPCPNILKFYEVTNPTSRHTHVELFFLSPCNISNCLK